MVFACNLLCASANAREYEEQVRIGDKMGALQNVFSPNLSWRTMISSFFSAFDQFRTMTPIDVVDILVVAYIIYRVMKLLKDTSAARLAKGILILVLIMLFASFLRLTMISWLLRNALSVGVFAVVVIFQPELRRLLEQIGKGNLSRMLIPDTDPNVVESMIVATVSACADMSRTKTGALIVFERKERLGEIIATGTRVDAAPSAELIKNIFFKNSPLHDGPCRTGVRCRLRAAAFRQSGPVARPRHTPPRGCRHERDRGQRARRCLRGDRRDLCRHRRHA